MSLPWPPSQAWLLAAIAKEPGLHCWAGKFVAVNQRGEACEVTVTVVVTGTNKGLQYQPEQQ